MNVTTLSNAQMNNCEKAKDIISFNARLYTAQGGSLFMRSYDKMWQFESQEVFDKCHFNMNQTIPMSDADFAKQQIGDIITL